MMVMVKIKQFLVVMTMIAKTHQVLEVMMVLVKIKQFLVGYDGDG